MESMLNLQVHDLAPVINRFVPYILRNTVIHDELKVIALAIMRKYRIVLVSSMYQPLTECFHVREIVLFTVYILCYHKIGFVDACFLHGFDIKEDILVTSTR